MKKGQIVTARVERVDFPNKGIARVIGEEGAADEFVTVKNTVAGQLVKAGINKVRHKKAEGRLLEILEKSPDEIESPCPHFEQCGGCTYQNLPYEKQVELKCKMVEKILNEAVEDSADKNWFQGIKPSPICEEYRNKMEFSFGDEYKDGPLALGMHKRGSFYDIVSVKECRLVHPDFRRVLESVLEYFKTKNVSYYHRMRHEGYLRHLLVRRGVISGEMLVCLVTSSQIDKATETELLDGYKEAVLAAGIEGKLVGILHTRNDSLADVVQNDGTTILYGADSFEETLLGLRFKITPFSFFQTNSYGAQVLYETAREYALSAMDTDAAEGNSKPMIFDLYSGTGTIAQMMAPVASRVTGVEIIEEAVEAAKENAKVNGLGNCSFIAGDVLKVLDDLKGPDDKPDLIILDPPRDGCHPKALPKIIEYGAPNMVYISCKITSLARDLEMLQAGGYRVVKAVAVDQFPMTGHVETCVLLSRRTYRQPDARVKIDIDLDDYYRIKER